MSDLSGGKTMDTGSDDKKLEKILHSLEKLEGRISNIETSITTGSAHGESVVEDDIEIAEAAPGGLLEYRVGEFWFAKGGIVILCVGIAFLLTLPFEDLPQVVPSFFGYMAVGALLLTSFLWKKTLSVLSGYLLGGAIVLQYFSTMRLHFFTPNPALEGMTVCIVLLLIGVVVSLVGSVRLRSQYLSGLSISLLYATAVLGGDPYFLFITAACAAVVGVWMYLRFGWQKLFVFSIFLTYTTHVVWLFNNPFLGNELRIVTEPSINLVFILLYALIFTGGAFLRAPRNEESNMVIFSMFMNSSSAYGTFMLVTVLGFSTYFPVYHLMAALVLLGISVAFWVRERSTYSTFFYSILGYIALSAAIVTAIDAPGFFIWLCVQTLLVVITAVWFRSKIIILANFLIYIGVFISYLIIAESIGVHSLIFGVTAVVSARILNWKKERLELRTDYMRTAYLVSAFIIFPYSFYYIFPKGIIWLSWIGIAAMYYGLSRLLDNIKYRWMALMTLLLTAIYIVIVGTTTLQPAYRILSFVVLGIVLIIISVFYTRKRLKEANSEESDQA